LEQTTLTSTGARSQVVEILDIQTKVISEGDFEGVAIAETWRDRGASTYYALAVLEKEKMRAVLLSQLRGAARRVHGDLVRADSAPTYLGRGKALIDALRASAERDATVGRARIVGYPVVENLPSTAEIARDLDAVLWHTRFQVEVQEVDQGTGAPRGDLPKLREQLEQVITEMGFKVAGDGAAPNVWLTCRMSLQEIQRGFDGHFVRWEGAWQLTGAPPHGPVVLSSKADGGESYSTASLARTRALAKGSAELSRDLERQISRYLRDAADH
jgi:hypothetical protein